jgi:hypothetical protein
VEWGGCEALLVDWLLEQRGANSKTDPRGSVFLFGSKRLKTDYNPFQVLPLCLRSTDDKAIIKERRFNNETTN